MRPAKSFWKNAQLWRTTCQWFCQRIMFDTLAAIAWLATRFCAVIASGRPISSTSAMPMSMCHCSASSVFGSLAVISVTTRPMKTGIGGVEQSDDEARDEQHREQPFGLAGKMPIEADQRRRRLRFAVASRVGARNFLKSLQHGR